MTTPAICGLRGLNERQVLATVFGRDAMLQVVIVHVGTPGPGDAAQTRLDDTASSSQQPLQSFLRFSGIMWLGSGRRKVADVLARSRQSDSGCHWLNVADL